MNFFSLDRLAICIQLRNHQYILHCIGNWNQQNGSGVDSDSALGLEELNPTPIPGGKWWSGVDSDSESRQNGVDSGFGVDSTGINYKSA